MFAARFRITFLAVLVAAVPAAGQKKGEEHPGMVQLHNGLLLTGVCGRANTVDPLLQNQKLELRRIDQGFRDYLVSTRKSDACVPAEHVVPKNTFRIIQRRVSQQPLNYAIGLHQQPVFDKLGRASFVLNAGAMRPRIDVGIVSLNSSAAEVHGLSHKWQYGISMNSLPESLLYTNSDSPGLVGLVKEYDDGETRLDLAQMLIDAEKFDAARQLLSDIEADFPELASRCERSVSRWNDRVGARVVTELNRLRDTGQFELAKKYARHWPDKKLDPAVRVQAKLFLDENASGPPRLRTLRDSLTATLADIADPDNRRLASHILTELAKDLDLNTLPRFAAYELLGQAVDVPPEDRFALAATGWLLGADNAVDRFPEALGLFQIRELLRDYLQTTDEESILRQEYIAEIRQQEGFSVERVAQLLNTLPPSASSNLNQSPEAGRAFEIPAAEDAVRCVGYLPEEYRPTRRYPLLIAFSRGGLSADDTLEWWRAMAQRHGYILVVPDLFKPDSVGYEASAEQHQDMMDLIVKLKTGLSIDDDRVFVAGHGIGGEVAMDLATSQPSLFAGMISIAGLGRKSFQWTAHNAPQLPWYVVVGTRQPYYTQRMELLLLKLFRRLTVNGRSQFCDVLLARYKERGFESYAEELPTIFKWMELQRRAKYQDRITAVTTRSVQRDWFWLELDTITDRFVSMDKPSHFDDRPMRKGTLSAEISGNLIRIRQTPSDCSLRLSPSIPGIDLEQRIKVRIGSRSHSIDYEPSTRDLLEDFHLRRDRSQLCFMKVRIRK